MFNVGFKIKPLYIVIAILIVFLAFSGRYGYKYIKKEEQALKTSINVLEEEKLQLQEQLEDLDVKEKNYYNEYVREYNKRIKAEKALRNIKFLTFNKQYLDSLARYIRFD